MNNNKKSEMTVGTRKGTPLANLGMFGNGMVPLMAG